MDDRPRIRIRYSPGRPGGLRWSGHPGWTWRCPCCKTGGRASSWSAVGHITPPPPPFQRIFAAVDKHLRDRHRDAHFAYVLRRKSA